MTCLFKKKNARFHEKKKKKEKKKNTTEKNFYHQDKIKFSSVEHLIWLYIYSIVAIFEESGAQKMPQKSDINHETLYG